MTIRLFPAGVTAALGRREISAGTCYADLSYGHGRLPHAELIGVLAKHSGCHSAAAKTLEKMAFLQLQAQGFALFDCGASAQGALHRITNLV